MIIFHLELIAYVGILLFVNCKNSFEIIPVIANNFQKEKHKMVLHIHVQKIT